MRYQKLLNFLFIFSLLLNACNSGTNSVENVSDKDSSAVQPVAIREDSLTYTYDGKTFHGFVSYDSNSGGKRPGILVVHEWWGLNDYSRDRAKQLAQLGYVAMAVDMYGDGDTAADPGVAQKLANPFYQDPTLCKTRLEQAMNQLIKFSEVDSTKMAAIGYCYGGFVVLNAAKLGIPLNGVVSFHGGLGGVTPNKDIEKAKILVLHGEADEFVNPEVPGFKKSMDSAGVDYTFKSYPDATHAFTNPSATENGAKFNMPIKYNASADSASWNDMKDFFKKIF